MHNSAELIICLMVISAQCLTQVASIAFFILVRLMARLELQVKNCFKAFILDICCLQIYCLSPRGKSHWSVFHADSHLVCIVSVSIWRPFAQERLMQKRISLLKGSINNPQTTLCLCSESQR